MKKSFVLSAIALISATLFSMTACKPEIKYVDKIYVQPVEFTYQYAESNVVLTMTCETEGASIYFTDDGTNPTIESNLYGDSLIYSASKIVKAFAVKDGMEPSPVSVANVTIVEKPFYVSTINTTGNYNVYYLTQKTGGSNYVLSNYTTYSNTYKHVEQNSSPSDIAIDITGFTPSCMYIRNNYIFVLYDRNLITYTFALKDGNTFSDGTTSKTVKGYYDESINKQIPPTVDGFYFIGWKDSKGNNIPEKFTANSGTFYATYKSADSFDFSGVKIGDIVLKNGIFFSKNDFQSDYKKDAIGIVISEPSEGNPAIILSIKANEKWHKWCTEDALAYNTSIEELKGSETDGLMDGSLAWDIIKKNYSDAEEHPEYYPAFQFALNHGSDNYPDSIFTQGWYLPTYAECKKIINNISVIRESLSTAGANYYLNNYYYTCTQYSQNDNSVYYYSASSNNFTFTEKNNSSGYAIYLHKLK